MDHFRTFSIPWRGGFNFSVLKPEQPSTCATSNSALSSPFSSRSDFIHGGVNGVERSAKNESDSRTIDEKEVHAEKKNVASTVKGVVHRLPPPPFSPPLLDLKEEKVTGLSSPVNRQATLTPLLLPSSHKRPRRALTHSISGSIFASPSNRAKLVRVKRESGWMEIPSTEAGCATPTQEEWSLLFQYMSTVERRLQQQEQLNLEWQHHFSLLQNIAMKVDQYSEGYRHFMESFRGKLGGSAALIPPFSSSSSSFSSSTSASGGGKASALLFSSRTGNEKGRNGSETPPRSEEKRGLPVSSAAPSSETSVPKFSFGVPSSEGAKDNASTSTEKERGTIAFGAASASAASIPSSTGSKPSFSFSMPEVPSLSSTVGSNAHDMSSGSSTTATLSSAPVTSILIQKEGKPFSFSPGKTSWTPPASSGASDTSSISTSRHSMDGDASQKSTPTVAFSFSSGNPTATVSFGMPVTTPKAKEENGAPPLSATNKSASFTASSLKETTEQKSAAPFTSSWGSKGWGSSSESRPTADGSGPKAGAFFSTSNNTNEKPFSLESPTKKRAEEASPATSAPMFSWGASPTALTTEGGSPVTPGATSSTAVFSFPTHRTTEAPLKAASNAEGEKEGGVFGGSGTSTSSMTTTVTKPTTGLSSSSSASPAVPSRFSFSLADTISSPTNPSQTATSTTREEGESTSGGKVESDSPFKSTPSAPVEGFGGFGFSKPTPATTTSPSTAAGSFTSTSFSPSPPLGSSFPSSGKTASEPPPPSATGTLSQSTPFGSTSRAASPFGSASATTPGAAGPPSFGARSSTSSSTASPFGSVSSAASPFGSASATTPGAAGAPSFGAGSSTSSSTAPPFGSVSSAASPFGSASTTTPGAAGSTLFGSSGGFGSSSISSGQLGGSSTSGGKTAAGSDFFPKSLSAPGQVAPFGNPSASFGSAPAGVAPSAPLFSPTGDPGSSSNAILGTSKLKKVRRIY